MKYRASVDANLDESHDYPVEWQGSDLVYRVVGKKVYRNVVECETPIIWMYASGFGGIFLSVLACL